MIALSSLTDCLWVQDKETLESKLESVDEERIMLQMELEELKESASEHDGDKYRLETELRDMKEEFERLKASGGGGGGGAGGGAAAAAVAPAPATAGEAPVVSVPGEDGEQGETIDLVLQRVQQLQKHLASCRDSVQHIISLPP